MWEIPRGVGDWEGSGARPQTQIHSLREGGYQSSGIHPEGCAGARALAAICCFVVSVSGRKIDRQQPRLLHVTKYSSEFSYNKYTVT